jgi:VWFA-related protein
MLRLFPFVLITLAGAAAQDQPAQPFQSGVTMIQVPVTVRDRDGHAVANLEKQDFQLFDDGKPVEIAGFSVEKPGSQAIPDRSLPIPNGPKPGAGAATDIPQHFITYFFDDLSMGGFSILTHIRDAAVKQINDLQPGDRVSIATSSCSVTQDFTNDRAKLLEAVSHLQIAPPQMCRYSAAVVLQIELLKDVVKRMADLPGRREILLVSGGFRVRRDDRWNGPADLSDAAVRAKVVINALDPGGATESAGWGAATPGYGKNGDVQSNFSNSATPQVLIDLAHGTGGAYVTGNDYDLNFRRLSTPECHYVLAFVPTAKDGKFHQLKVKLEKKGKYTVEVRNGYYAPKRAE